MDYKKVFGLLLVGIVILAAMIIFIGPGQIIEALQQANMSYVFLAIIIQFVIMSLWDIKWSFICSELSIPHKKLSLFAMLLVGLAMNNLTPSGRGGGEPVRAYLLTKNSGVPFKTTFATVLGDKLFDTFPFLVLAVVALLYLIFGLHLGQATYISLIIILILFFILIGLIIYMCINEAFGVRAVKWTFRQLRRFMSRNLDPYENKALLAIVDFQNSLRQVLSNRNIFSKACLIAFVVWILELLRVYVVFLAFGTHVSIGMIAAVFIVSTLVGMIPALPGGLGAIDGVMILLYSLAGIPASVSTAATIVERLISFWMVSVMGLLILPYFGTGVLDEVNNRDDLD